MSEIINIYCDESCHLEHDQKPIMLLGAVWCPQAKVKEFSQALRAIKSESAAQGELKWNKVSRSREGFFLRLAEFFFETPNLNFRCLVVDEKAKLNHSYFNQGSHDSFYYKMYFYLLRNIISVKKSYNIFIDIKDTRSQRRIRTLAEILRADAGDSQGTMIPIIQNIRSHESELMQLADLLIGAIAYYNRNLKTSKAKVALVQHIQTRAGTLLNRSTPPWEEKFNLFFFSPREVQR